MREEARTGSTVVAVEGDYPADGSSNAMESEAWDRVKQSSM